ncbi:hypothetical protein ACTFQ7_27475 [Bacillus cereus group sp. MYBK226-2]|uniref:hypothetical protein n=1 Tax=Bacillus cereus group sp. MYBK226-2 TaxID=3450655 RepID=UPI003F79EBD7
MNETKTTKDLVLEWEEELIAEKLTLDNKLKELEQQKDFAWVKYAIVDDAAKRLEHSNRRPNEYKQLKSLSDKLKEEHEELEAVYKKLENEVAIKTYNLGLLQNEIDKRYPNNERLSKNQ